MKLREVAPSGYQRGAAFVTRARGCGLEDVRTPRYDVGLEARALVALRKEVGIGLRDAASKIGIRAIELSGLEHGRLVPEDAHEWAKMMTKLQVDRNMQKGGVERAKIDGFECRKADT